MPDIVITEFMDEAAVGALRDDFDVLYRPDLYERPSEIAQLAREGRAIIVRNRTQVRGDLLEAATHLKCVGRLGVGLDNIDVDACGARGIVVFPANGANDVAVAEYVLGAALMLLRRSFMATPAVAAGDWPRETTVGLELYERSLGLVGFGSIARQVAVRAAIFGMRCIANDPFVSDADIAAAGVEPSDLPTLLASADVVSLHTPLTAETRGLIGAGQLALMRRDAILINAARGGIVDEEALAAALRSGRLAGAALDVFAHEPLDAAAGSRFLGLPNVILTPHIAGVTVESNRRVSALVASRVRDHLTRSR